MSTVECGLTGKLCREILSLGPSGKTFDRSRRYPSSENQNKRRRNAGIQQWSSANGVTGAKAVPLRLTFLSESQSSVLFVAIKETFLDALTVSWHNRYEVNEYRNNRSNSDGSQQTKMVKIYIPSLPNGQNIGHHEVRLRSSCFSTRRARQADTLYTDNPNTVPLKWTEDIWRRPGIGNKYVDFADRTNQCWPNLIQFAGIGYHNHLF